MSTEPDRDRRRRTAAILSLAVGVGMLGAKWLAYALTGSHAILSDALESVVHVSATAFALMSILLGSRPPDQAYPYGYGKIAYFSAGFEGGMIALAALAILYEAIQGLIEGSELQSLDLGLALIGGASLVNLALGLLLLRRGRETNSLVLTADGHHVLSDAYTSFGVVLGVGLVRITGLGWIDAVVAILAALNILRTGYGLVQEAFSGLMDRADRELLERLVRALDRARDPGWLDLHQLRAWRAGDRTFVDLHLVVPADWRVTRLHDVHDRVREVVREQLGEQAEAIVHFDPERADTPAETPWTVDTAVRTPGGDGESIGAQDDETTHSRAPAHQG